MIPLVRWEYKVSSVPTTPRELQAHLDEDGAAEWELVSTTPLSSRLLLLFKRPNVSAQTDEYVQEQTEETSEEQDPSLAEEVEQTEYAGEPIAE